MDRVGSANCFTHWTRVCAYTSHRETAIKEHRPHGAAQHDTMQQLSKCEWPESHVRRDITAKRLNEDGSISKASTRHQAETSKNDFKENGDAAVYAWK